MLRKLKLFWVMLLLAAVVLPVTAYAADQTDLADPELTIYFQTDRENVVGANFELYKIADFTEDWGLVAVDRFSVFSDSLIDVTDAPRLAAELEYYTLEFGMNPDGTCTTDRDGIAKHPKTGETLERGLYLIIGRQHVQNGYIYDLNPMLVCFPHYDEVTGEFTTDCRIKAKYEQNPMPEDGKISRKVLKIWLDKGYEEHRPTFIKVKLMKNREVFQTVLLSRENNWKHTWEELDADAEWTILEEPLDNYRASVELEGITYKLTNEYSPPSPPTEPPGPPTEPTTPPEKPPKLPQTGQLWWPVPILLLMGIMFVAVGLVRRREEYYED